MSNKSLIGNLKTVVVGGESENPHFAPEHAGKEGNPKTIAVSYNAMESPLALYYRRKSIDQYQLSAGSHFRRIYEGAGGAGAGGMDYAAVRVDTSASNDPISDYKMDCHMHLKVVENHVGSGIYPLMREVCGRGVFINELFNKTKDKEDAMKCVKEGLRLCAELWGYSTKRSGVIHPYNRSV